MRPRLRNLRGQRLRLDPAFLIAPEFSKPYHSKRLYRSRDCPGQGAILDVDDHGVGAEGLELWLGGLVVATLAIANTSIFIFFEYPRPHMV